LSLTISEDLQTFMFRAHYEETLELLRRRRLKLSGSCFIGCHDNTSKQIWRLWKYIRRGFKW
jgi:hypothetical protein